MKRLLVTILAVMMCFTSLTVCSVFAEEGEETDELWATSVSYRRMAFTDLMDAGKLLTAKIDRVEPRGSFMQINISIYLVDF